MLVVGAGGGLEIRAMAEARPDWRFTGIDPSPAMLELARQTISACAERTRLVPLGAKPSNRGTVRGLHTGAIAP
nr:class I SAM-dependent methyltransferase [Rhizobium leguminosarum]